MPLHWKTNLSAEIILVIGTLGFAVALAGAAMLVGDNRVRGDPGPPDDIGALQVTVFTSPQGDYRFEAPAAWTHPLDPRDVTLEAFFVGPVDRARHTVVMMTVSRYSQGVQTASTDRLLEQLGADKRKHMLGTEAIVVDQRPARLVRIHELASAPSPSLEVVNLDLKESLVIVENGPEVFVLEYTASPEVYGDYWPIFDRLLTSFHFQDRP